MKLASDTDVCTGPRTQLTEILYKYINIYIHKAARLTAQQCPVVMFRSALPFRLSETK